jgi:hypothetical protein
MSDVLYIIGPPAVGKSAVMEALVGGRPGTIDMFHTLPVPHVQYGSPLLGRGPVAQLGSYAHGQFPGTDSLAMNIMPKMIAWLKDCEYNLLLGEGDRLASDIFFRTAADNGRLWVVNLFAPPEVLAARRLARPGTQNAAWVRGRETKCERLAGGWATLGINTKWANPEQAAEQIRRHVEARRL